MSTQNKIAEELMVGLNQEIMTNYGNRLTISDAIERGKVIELKLDYNRIIHIYDSSTNTIYVRNINFPFIFNGDIQLNQKFKLPLDEINKSVDNKYIELRANMAQNIIYNKKVILPLIKKVSLFSAFLNKFNDIISALTYDSSITKEKINQRLEADPGYQKYFEVIVKSGYATYDKNMNLKASEKLKVLHKDMMDDKSKTNKTKDVIDEIMFNVIKDHYDYIVYHLKLKILRTYVNLLSCLNYVTTTQKSIKHISMQVKDLFKVYKMFYGDITEFKFEERINYLANAEIIMKERDTISWLGTNISHIS